MSSFNKTIIFVVTIFILNCLDIILCYFVLLLLLLYFDLVFLIEFYSNLSTNLLFLLLSFLLDFLELNLSWSFNQSISQLSELQCGVSSSLKHTC